MRAQTRNLKLRHCSLTLGSNACQMPSKLDSACLNRFEITVQTSFRHEGESSSPKRTQPTIYNWQSVVSRARSNPMNRFYTVWLRPIFTTSTQLGHGFV